KFSVIPLATTTEKWVSWDPGSSPLAGFFCQLIVGSDSSSATNGSSVASVAGKNRLPAKPCARLVSGATRQSAATSAARAIGWTLISAPPVGIEGDDRLWFAYGAWRRRRR